MHALDPKGRWWPGHGAGGGEQPEDPNISRLLTCGLVGAMCLAFASFAPPPFVPLLLAELLRLAALGSAAEALLREEAVFAPNLTAWDQAALLLGTALFLRLVFGVPPSPLELGASAS